MVVARGRGWGVGEMDAGGEKIKKKNPLILCATGFLNVD